MGGQEGGRKEEKKKTKKTKRDFFLAADVIPPEVNSELEDSRTNVTADGRRAGMEIGDERETEAEKTEQPAPPAPPRDPGSQQGPHSVAIVLEMKAPIYSPLFVM